MTYDIDPPNMDGITPADQRTAFKVGQLFYAVLDLHYLTRSSDKTVLHWCGQVPLYPALALARVASAAVDALPRLRDQTVRERYSQRIDELLQEIGVTYLTCERLSDKSRMAFWLGYSAERNWYRLRAKVKNQADAPAKPMGMALA